MRSSFVCLSHPPSPSPAFRGWNASTLLLSNYKHSVEKHIFSIICLLIRTQSTHQNVGYSDVRTLSPSCSEIPCKVKCQDSMGHRVSGEHTRACKQHQMLSCLFFTTSRGCEISCISNCPSPARVILSFPVTPFSLVNHENIKFTNYNMANI